MERSRHSILYQGFDIASFGYDLPTLSTRELVTCFQSMHINVTEQDLLHPTQDGTQEIFRTILGLVKSWRMKYVPRTLGDDIMTEEIHAVWPLYFEIKNLLAVLGYKDFETSDLIHPTPQRLARTLSALANFAMFRESRWAVFEPQAKRIEDLAEKLENKRERGRQLDKEIQELEAQMQEEDMETEELRKDNAQFENELRNMRSLADSLQQELNHQKEKKQKLKNSMQNIQYKLLTMNEDISAYKRIENVDTVQLRENIAKLPEQSSVYNTQIEMLQSALHEKNAEFEDLAEFEENLEARNRLLQEMQKLLSECDLQQASIKEIEGDINKLMEKSRELQKREDALHRAQQQLEVIIKQDEAQEEKTHESVHQRLMKSSDELESAQKEVFETNAETLQSKARIAKLQQELDTIRQESDTECQAIQAKYNDLGSALSEYLDRLINAIEGTQPPAHEMV